MDYKPLMASWRSGYAADCKSVYSGSNPDEASKQGRTLWVHRSSAGGFENSRPSPGLRIPPFPDLEILDRQRNLLPMKNLLACLVLLCSATSSYAAEPQRWCTGFGTDQQAELVFLDEGPFIQIDGKVTELPDKWHVHFATMDYESHGITYRDQKVVIYNDRVFWPCS